MSLHSSLYTYVQAQGSITALIGTRFRPQILMSGDSGTPDAPQSATVYRRNSKLPTVVSSGDTGLVKTLVTMTHFAWTYDAAVNVAEQFRLKLHGKTGTVGDQYFSSCCLVAESDDLESLQFAQNDAPYFVTQEFQIVHRDTPTGL